MPSIHARLRAATAEAHATLDARVAGGLCDRQRYATYLLGMHYTVAAFETASARLCEVALPSAWRPAARARRLDADLDALALAPLPPPGFDLDGTAEWLGAWYVIEGSALGARMLLRQLQSQPFAATVPSGFLQAHASPDLPWRACLARLESRPETDAPALIAGALRMFTTANAGFALAAARTC